jgi:hypothetical protein
MRNQSTCGEVVSLPLYQPQILHDMTWNWTWPAIVRSQWQTTWAVAWPTMITIWAIVQKVNYNNELLSCKKCVYCQVWNVLNMLHQCKEHMQELCTTVWIAPFLSCLLSKWAVGLFGMLIPCCQQYFLGELTLYVASVRFAVWMKLVQSVYGLWSRVISRVTRMHCLVKIWGWLTGAECAWYGVPPSHLRTPSHCKYPVSHKFPDTL